MRAENPTPQPTVPRRSVRLIKSNRIQIALFSILTLLLTAATVWAGRAWLRNSETLVFAVGDASGPEARFATRLAAILKSNSSRLKLKIVSFNDNARAIAAFDRKEASLAILRTDAKIPAKARAVAILEHDLVLLISPAGKKIATVASLKKKKIAVLSDNDSDTTLVRTFLSENHDGPARIQMAPPGSSFEKLFASGFGAVVAVAHTSRIVKDKSYEQNARRGGFTLNAIDSAKAITRKYPAVTEAAVTTGMLSASPAIPDDDVDTIGLDWLLVAQSRLPAATASDLARAVYENKAELALHDGFASKIEPADTDKDAFIVAHPGAAEYINDEVKSFIERYSDLLYVALAALSIIGSIFAAIYTKITRTAPERASELAAAVLEIGERMQDANTVEALDDRQDELEEILRRVVTGLHDGTISSDGLETFKLGYEFVRDEIALRRDYLKRHPAQDVAAHDANVVAVKSAQSA